MMLNVEGTLSSLVVGREKKKRMEERLTDGYRITLFWSVLLILGITITRVQGAQEVSGKWINEGKPTAVTGPADVATLQFVQVLWRHGDRTAASLIPTDKDNDEKTWPEGLGELTTTGMAQQLRLGQFLKKRYGELLGSKYDRNSAYIRSSDYNRTLMSAMANLAGLFPPRDDEQFFNGLKWRPIPVHTVPKEEDVQLYEEISCPTAEEERKRIYREFPRALAIKKKNEGLFKYLENVTGMSPFGMDNIWKVYDPLFAQSCHNSSHHWPAWMNESLWKRIEEVYDDSSRFSFHTSLLRRLRGGPLVHEVLDRFTDKSNGGLDRMKMYAYSAHDTTLAAILATFGIFPLRFPLYATAIMVEMHKRDGDYYIELYHKNMTDSPDVYMHEVEGCPMPCRLKTLKEAMSPYAPVDWKGECGLGKENITRYIIAVTVLALTSVILFTFLVVDVYLKYRRREPQDGHRLLLTEDDS